MLKLSIIWKEHVTLHIYIYMYIYIYIMSMYMYRYIYKYTKKVLYCSKPSSGAVFNCPGPVAVTPWKVLVGPHRPNFEVSRVSGVGFRVQGLGFRAQGCSGFRALSPTLQARSLKHLYMGTTWRTRSESLVGSRACIPHIGGDVVGMLSKPAWWWLSFLRVLGLRLGFDLPPSPSSYVGA